MTKPGLGRLQSPDARDTRFLMARRLAPPGAPLPTRKTWRINARNLDQGPTGTCVGHACYNFLRSEPIQSAAKSVPSPFAIYRAAVKLDIWTDNDHEATDDIPDGDARLEFGTSIRAGMQALMGFERLKSYLWAFALQPALEFVLTQGPVVLGVNWYSTFNSPDDEGIVRITENARLEGGHAVLWRGADTRRGLARISNSWGEDWGRGGDFFLPLRDLERLIHEEGEACTAIEQKVKPAKVATP